MEIIPAIDLREGKCVRLTQGREEMSTQYSDDPVSVARRWAAQGARRLHVVNLDGAFGRASENLNVMREIARVPGVVVQFGGGLRSVEDVRGAFDAGATMAVVGTLALESPEAVRDLLQEFGTERIIVAVDGKNGKVVTRGWKDVRDETVAGAAIRMKRLGVTTLLYTDVDRDGMMSGPDLETLKDLADLPIDVIASGGISSGSDLRNLLDLQRRHIRGAIVGKALYEGRVTLGELLSEVSRTRASARERQ